MMPAGRALPGSDDADHQRIVFHGWHVAFEHLVIDRMIDYSGKAITYQFNISPEPANPGPQEYGQDKTTYQPAA
jgi:hypothetical protein